MNVPKLTMSLIAIAFTAIVCFCSQSANAQCTSWQRPTPSIGHNGRIEAIVDFNYTGGSAALIVGGTFTTIGGTPCANIAEASPSGSWIPLGTGTNGIVTTLVNYNGNLIVGGSFTAAGGVASTRYLALWDGFQWFSLTPTVPLGPVNAMTVFNGNLYIGGETTSGNGYVMLWNGSSLTSIPGTFDGPVRACVTRSSINEVYVGGSFTSVTSPSGTIFCSGAMRYYPPAGANLPWQFAGNAAGPNGQVYRMNTDASGNIYAVGLFDPGSPNLRGIGKFNGVVWSSMDLGLGSAADFHPVQDVIFWNGAVYATGWFTVSGRGTAMNHIARWSGTAWGPLDGVDLNSNGFALGTHNGNLIVGGAFSTSGGATTNGIASWDGAVYSALVPAFDGVVRAMTYWDADGAGANAPRLVYGGDFLNSPAGGPSRGIASFTGSTWNVFGNFANTRGFNDSVRALVSWDADGTGAGVPVLVAAGLFTTADGVAINRIARFNNNINQNWSGFGTGMNGEVRALAVYQNKLVAGGNFTTANSVALNRIAMWNGSTWTAMGPGGADNIVNTLYTWGNDLYAGGFFNTIGGTTASRIARWNGSTWSAVGTGVTSGFSVNALARYNGNLYAGGAFVQMGGVAANRIAMWNGTSWSALGTGLSGIGFDIGCNSLAVYDSKLIVSGLFTGAGALTQKNIAAWDGANWSSLNSGESNGPIYSSLTANNFTSPYLNVGGDFSRVSGQTNQNFARYYTNRVVMSPQPEDVEVLRGANILLRLSYSYPPSESPSATVWKRNGVTISSGPTAWGSTYGASTLQLSITNAQPEDFGFYTATVTDSCGASVSEPALVLVFCPSDFNRDETVDFFDYLDFVGNFAQGSIAADFNHDGVVDFFDYLDFVANFAGGC